ncbi:MAG: DUF2141 domain-containing protein [Acidobacteria bacterium]|nr:DUF2141 domain-containing protein [Acidobacteriota bacterium]
MTSVCVVALLLIAAPQLPARDTPTGKLTVTIINVRSDSGYVRIALFNSPETHLKSSFRSERIPATGQHCVVVLDQLPYGEFTFIVHHDENGNGKMDKNFLGMPKEGYAFSRGARVSFGAPSYRDCTLKLEASELSVVVKLSY